MAKKVIGYEIDERLKPILSETLAGLNNVEINFNNYDFNAFKKWINIYK